MDAVRTILMLIQILSAIALIAVVMSQTTKSEGLSGTIGGKATSAFRGKPGSEERLSYWTKVTAVAFMLTSVLVAYIPH